MTAAPGTRAHTRAQSNRHDTVCVCVCLRRVLVPEVAVSRGPAPPAPGPALLAVRLGVLGPGVVVQALRHEVPRQGVGVPGGLLDLGPLVLEPDLDLGLVEAQVQREALPPLLRQVPVVLELRLQPLQLRRREGRPGPLVLSALDRGLLRLPGPGP